MTEARSHINLSPMSTGKRIRVMIAGTLYCTACEDWHPKDNFPRDLRASFSRRSICRKAMYHIQAKRRRAIRKKRRASP